MGEHGRPPTPPPPQRRAPRGEGVDDASGWRIRVNNPGDTGGRSPAMPSVCEAPCRGRRRSAPPITNNYETLRGRRCIKARTTHGGTPALARHQCHHWMLQRSMLATARMQQKSYPSTRTHADTCALVRVRANTESSLAFLNYGRNAVQALGKTEK